MDIWDLKRELSDKRLEQQEVARRMGVSGAQLSRLLNGSRPWKVIYLRAFAMATGIPMTFIAVCLGTDYQSECSQAIELETPVHG